jgi:putative transposase
LIELPKSTFYYTPNSESPQTLKIMRAIDEIYTEHPEYGTRRIMFELNRINMAVGRDRIRTLMKLMGIEAIYPKRNLSKPCPGNKIYPYMLRGIEIDHVNQVWSTDITYIRMQNGFLYLTAVIDWFSRYVIAWKISNTLDGLFCREVLLEAIETGKPKIFNTDQG